MERAVWTILFLGINGIYDIKCRRICKWSFPVFFSAGAAIWMRNGRDLLSLAAAFIPGILLLLAGKVTNEAVGYGDGLTVLMLGVCHGLWKVCEIVLGGMLLSAVWGGILLIVKKKGWKQEFPWIPFLFLAYLGGMFIK
ncbi:MAG: hypothetical protein ACOX8E_01085 [Ruminococcus sp.]